jgi:hypothetical protein
MAQTNKYRIITIYNQTYKLPIDGMGNWGEEATAILEALSESLSLLIGPNDILPSSASINNNATNVNLGNVSLNLSQIRRLEFEYVVEREYGPESDKTVLTQSGVVTGNYNPETSEWLYSHEYEGFAGVSFDFVGNKIKYTSTSLPTDNYKGSAKFKGSALDKVSQS